jgi:hypothetical protein
MKPELENVRFYLTENDRIPKLCPNEDKQRFKNERGMLKLEVLVLE